jgi:hypothetical protein
LTLIEQASSSPPTDGGSGGGGTIARNPLMHLAGTGRVNSVNHSTGLHRLAWVVALLTRRILTATAMGQSRAEEGQGAVRLMICTAGVPAVEMACGVDPGTSILEGSNIQENWATDFGGAVGRGRGNKAGEAEDVLGTIAGGRGSSGFVASARSRWQW